MIGGTGGGVLVRIGGWGEEYEERCARGYVDQVLK